MRTQTFFCGALAALLFLCTGCGTPHAEIPSPTPSAQPPAVSAPAVTPTPAAPPEPAPQPVPTEEVPGITTYTLDLETAVNNRTLTLRLHGRIDTTDGFERIGIRAVDVLEGNILLQTLSVQDAFDALYTQEGLDGMPAEPWTQCWTKDGALTTEDLNFDGYPDIRLMGTAGTVNITYLCWLWDAQAGQFDYAFSLLGYDVRVDSVAQQLITQYRDGYGQYYTDYYRYDNESKTLLLMKQVLEDMVNQTTTVHELVDGIWTQTG